MREDNGNVSEPHTGRRYSGQVARYCSRGMLRWRHQRIVTTGISAWAKPGASS